MARHSWKPPRYFPGYIVAEQAGGQAVKWLFEGAIFVPADAHTCLIFDFTRGPFVEKPDRKVRGVVLEIQYAISVFSAGGSYLHKYNHPFDTRDARIEAAGHGYIIRSKRPLFRSYPVPEVMPEAKGCPLRVVQFVA